MQQDNIKVSVLTPIYNHSLIYVRQCLDSLKAQTMQEIEFILIDNGAPEDAKRLISEYESMDSRFRVIHFAENQGYGKAMNAGLDAALDTKAFALCFDGAKISCSADVKIPAISFLIAVSEQTTVKSTSFSRTKFSNSCGWSSRISTISEISAKIDFPGATYTFSTFG